jgi:hypothetical protein
LVVKKYGLPLGVEIQTAGKRENGGATLEGSRKGGLLASASLRKTASQGAHYSCSRQKTRERRRATPLSVPTMALV